MYQGGITLDVNNIITIISCLIGIIFLGIIFKFSVFKILKLILNSILGGILIFIINQIGGSFGLHIGLNVFTSLFIGVLGIPGAILLLAIKII